MNSLAFFLPAIRWAPGPGMRLVCLGCIRMDSMSGVLSNTVPHIRDLLQYFGIRLCRGELLESRHDGLSSVGQSVSGHSAKPVLFSRLYTSSHNFPSRKKVRQQRHTHDVFRPFVTTLSAFSDYPIAMRPRTRSLANVFRKPFLTSRAEDDWMEGFRIPDNAAYSNHPESLLKVVF